MCVAQLDKYASLLSMQAFLHLCSLSRLSFQKSLSSYLSLTILLSSCFFFIPAISPSPSCFHFTSKTTPISLPSQKIEPGFPRRETSLFLMLWFGLSHFLFPSISKVQWAHGSLPTPSYLLINSILGVGHPSSKSAFLWHAHNIAIQ